MFNNFPPPPESRTVYEIMWKSTVELERPQMTIWCMLFTCWISKAKTPNSEYIILIAFDDDDNHANAL